MITAHIEPSGVLTVSGPGTRPESVHLIGARASSRARLTGRGKTWTARLPLTASRWGGPALPLPAGDYRLRAVWSGGQEQDLQTADAPLVVTDGLRAQVDGAKALVRVGPPVDPAYDSGEGQDALERRYIAQQGAALEQAVFFESFYGRFAACNPLALDREISRRAPGIVRYWSVVDLSVRVPEGAVPVVEGSPEWWRARGAARLLIINDWMRRKYTRRRGQRVLQTWHGTPLKRLALHRPGFDPRRIGAVLKESVRWNVLLAQNAYAARILRKAYAFLRRPVWVEGSPRNDILVNGDPDVVRARLGVDPSDRVLLYAPTWRDDRDEIVDFIDPAELARRTGAVVLVRGHSRTLLPGRDADGERVVDVTAYPDVSELLLAADALVTDYSSVMFDFTVTGKPIYFLVPDLEHYRGRLRGFYFDLAAAAPGPVVRTLDDLVDAVQDPNVPARYAYRYARWRRLFNDREDGRAAERVVARLFDQRFLEEPPESGSGQRGVPAAQS